MRLWDKRAPEIENQIVELNRAAFEDTERAPDGRVRDAYATGVVFVAMNGPRLLGYALVTTDDRRWNEPYVWSIAVRAESRGQGIGKNLLDDIGFFAFEECAEGISLMVNANNVAAMRLYLAEGYRVKKVIPGYYRDGVDGVHMRRVL